VIRDITTLTEQHQNGDVAEAAISV